MGVCGSDRTRTASIDTEVTTDGHENPDAQSRRFQSNTSSPSNYSPNTEVLYNGNPTGGNTKAALTSDKKKLSNFTTLETQVDRSPGSSRPVQLQQSYRVPIFDGDAIRKHLNSTRSQNVHRYTPVLHDHSHHHTLSFNNPDNKNFEISLRFNPSGSEILGQFDPQDEPPAT